MMRNLPHYFRGEEAHGLDFHCQFDFTGEGGGRWAMQVAEGRCRLQPGRCDSPDLTVRCDAKLFLAIHREEANAVIALLLGRIRLDGNRRLFLAFPRILGMTPAGGVVARLAWRLQRLHARFRKPRAIGNEARSR
jgi:putative sterol carrier protein